MAVGLLTSCGASAATPTPPPVVNVAMTEYHFAYPTPIHGGPVVFHITNSGHISHRLAIVSLPPELPPIVTQLRSADKRNVDELAGIPTRQPGEWGTFEVDLKPGRYAFVCFVADPDGVSHGAKGMASDFWIK